jgi:hypothetical protein
MTKSLALCLVSTLAFAQGKPDKPAARSEAVAAPTQAGGPPGGPPPMPKPGPEHKALQFFVGTMTGEGKLEPGANGPGSPATTSKAKHTCKWILENFWLSCDVTDAAKGGMTWMGHMLIGYDLEAKSYRAVGADNMGSAFDLNGKMDGKKFVLESARETTMMGMPVKFRFTFDTTDPKAIKFTDERSLKGGPWQLAETVTFKKPG